MKRFAKIATLIVAVVGLLALASCLTTGIQWDGGFPGGEFRVILHNPEGKPVKGAILRVYHSGTRDLAFGYPLDNHVAGRDLISDESGWITAFHESRGSEFGGHSWELFWVITMGAKAPDYDCEISAVGFKRLTFSVCRLFNSSHTIFILEPN
ncbi:MAG: hypothetical protein IH991_09265 [Planctomycetes bacterium]|nr:hypothetical protein [Planctomycetota bacterium]